MILEKRNFKGCGCDNDLTSNCGLSPVCHRKRELYHVNKVKKPLFGTISSFPEGEV